MTRVLLKCGVAGAAIFPAVVLLQGLTRDGFDLAVHPLSMLSLGDLGWIQITNFIVTGFLFIAFAVGLRRALGSDRGGVWGPRLFGFYGVVLVAAGVFTVDPMYGFPPGTPPGLPETLSWHAIVHNLTFVFAFLGLIIATFVFARRFASLGRWGLAAYSALTGAATPGLIVLSQMTPAATGYILFGMGLLVDVWIVVLASVILAELQRAGAPAVV